MRPPTITTCSSPDIFDPANANNQADPVVNPVPLVIPGITGYGGSPTLNAGAFGNFRDILIATLHPAMGRYSTCCAMTSPIFTTARFRMKTTRAKSCSSSPWLNRTWPDGYVVLDSKGLPIRLLFERDELWAWPMCSPAGITFTPERFQLRTSSMRLRTGSSRCARCRAAISPARNACCKTSCCRACRRSAASRSTVCHPHERAVHGPCVSGARRAGIAQHARTASIIPNTGRLSAVS